MNIIVHAGGGKTGSTTIQDFCFRNEANLQMHGICYPGNCFNHFDLFQQEFNGSIALVQGNLCRLIEEGLNKKASVLLLSAEGVQPVLTDLDFLGHDVHIMQYMRQFPSYNESALAQSFKAEYKAGMRGLFLNRAMFFQGISAFELLEARILFDRCSTWHPRGADGELAWTRALDKKFTVSTYSYEDASSEGLLQHFCSQIGITDLTGFEMPPAKANVTPCTAALFFVGHCNCLPLPTALRCELLTYIEKNVVCTDRRKYLLVAPETYRKWMNDEQATMQAMSSLIGDPLWIDKCFAWLEGKEVVPYKNLPIPLQHEIFSNLPEHLQNAITAAWPVARLARKDEALLPPLPTSLEAQCCLEAWFGACWDHERTVEQRTHALEVAQQQNLIVQGALANAHSEIHRLHDEIAGLYSSLSWRLTTGLRKAGTFFQRLRAR